MKSIEKEVRFIVEKVKKEGDRALEYFSKKFDRTPLSNGFVISKERMRRGYLQTSPEFKSALQTAKNRIERFHKEELKRLPRKWSVNIDGIAVGQVSFPLESVGIYVPGGRYPYPSTILMASIPAKVAGVSKIVMVTPPKNLKEEILAAAYLCEVDQCFLIGGPQAVAALAFGTQSIPKVDKIVGPGNQYVTEAKRQLFGQVGIDGLAGPSEIAVWADSFADSYQVALNLCAQAEHDPQSQSFLLVQNKKKSSEILAHIPKNFLKQIRVIVQERRERLIDEINEIAPEHLYLAVKNARQLIGKIRNAGAIFLGEETPVALGDYSAGPSHVLPTRRSAKFNSGLSVKDFLKWSSLIENRSKKDNEAFLAARILATTEGLNYHSLSLEV